MTFDDDLQRGGMIGFSSDSTDVESLGRILASIEGPRAISVGVTSVQVGLAAALVDAADQYEARPLLHLLDLDLAGVEPVAEHTLDAMAAMARLVRAPWVTADLAVWAWDGQLLGGSLLGAAPVGNALDYLCDRICAIQDSLPVPLALENPPFPVTLGDLDVLQLMRRMHDLTGAKLCIDLGHILGNCVQRGLDPISHLRAADLPWSAVVETHIAGGVLRTVRGRILYEDAHDWPITEAVWTLLDGVEDLVGDSVIVIEAEGLSEATTIGSLRRLATLVGTSK